MAAPALYWSYMTKKLTKKKGVQRAKAALASAMAGKITSDKDSATLVNKKFIATIRCIVQGSKIMIIIIVAGGNGNNTLTLNQKLTSAMDTGLMD